MAEAGTSRERVPTEQLVSVIIPTANRAGYLREAMESVFAQSHRPIELIVVDDGSTDATCETIRAFSACHAGDREFSCQYLQQHRRGPLVARNKAIEGSHGRFIQFLDDDDTLHPEKLATQVGVLGSEPDVDAVVCQTVYCNERMQAKAVSRVFTGPNDTDMVAFFLDLRHDIAIHAPLFRRAAIDAVGGWDERVTHGGEVELHLRMAISGVRFRFTHDEFAYARCHRSPGRLTIAERKTPASDEREFYERIVRYSEAQKGHRDESLRAGAAQRLVRIGRRHYASCRPGIGKGCLEAARELSSRHQSLRLRVYTSRAGCIVGTFVEVCGHLATRAARLAIRLTRPPSG